MDRIEQFQQWVNEPGKRRQVDIKINRQGKSINKEFQIWVYDYDLGVGQFVNSVDDIDLDAVAEKKLREDCEKLKAKIEAKQASKV